MPQFDALRSDKSDRRNRGCEANYINRLRRATLTLHVGADGMVDGYVKNGKVIYEIPVIGRGFNSRPITDWITYDYNARGQLWPVCEIDVNFQFNPAYFK